MARPRKITDERLLHAAGLVIARIGPKFVLADVAAEAGVATGTLMHRFGSKHGLLVAMIDGATAAIESDGPAGPAGPDGPSTPSAPGVTSGPDGPDPVRAVRDRIVAHYAALDDARSAANNLAQLAVDLADDDLRPRMARLHAAVERALEPLLADGFPGAPPPPVAAPGVVDEDVEPAPLLVADPGHQGLDVGRHHVVAAHRDAVTAGRGHQLGGLLDGLRAADRALGFPGGTAGDVYGRAGRTQLDGHAPPGPAGRPGHQRDGVVQLHR